MNIMIGLKVAGNIRHSCQLRADLKALIFVSIELLKVIFNFGVYESLCVGAQGVLKLISFLISPL